MDEKIQLTYLVFDGKNYKIGKSKNPDKRLMCLNTSNPSAQLVATSNKIDEKSLHEIFDYKRVILPSGKKSEWFSLDGEEVYMVLTLMRDGQSNFCNSFEIEGKYHWSERAKLNRKYKIDFGKYNGRKLTSMQSPEEINYLKWFIKNYKKSPSGKKSWGSRRYSKFCWWLGELKKEEIEESDNRIKGLPTVKEMKEFMESNMIMGTIRQFY